MGTFTIEGGAKLKGEITPLEVKRKVFSYRGLYEIIFK